MFEVQGRVALVSGAGNGMGRSHARGLARAGFRLALVDVDERALAEVAGELTSAGLTAIGVPADVTSEGAVADVVATTKGTFGRIDVLVNNAGGALGASSLAETSLAEWDATLRLNLTSQFLCIRAVLPTMISQGGGKIINVASASVFNGATAALYRDDVDSNLVPYLAAKGGVVGLTRALAREVGRWNIAVNAVAPGFTPTERVRRTFPEKAMQSVWANQAFARAQRSDDVTGAVLFLATDASEFVTGQVICVDGGWTMG